MVRLEFKNIGTLFLLIAMGLLATTACTQKSEPGSVRIVLPTAPRLTSAADKGSVLAGLSNKTQVTYVTKTVTAMNQDNGPMWNSSLNPTIGAEINCFAVFIGGPDLNPNTCYDSDGNVMAEFGPNGGFYPAGAEIVLETPPGSNRRIYVLGLVAINGGCESYVNSQPDSSNLSEPFMIADVALSIPSGPSTVTISAALDTDLRVDSCTFIDGGGGGGGSNIYPFGDVRDGTILLGGSTGYLDFAMDDYTITDVTHTPDTYGYSSTKMFGASERVVGIAASGTYAGRQLSLYTSVTSNQFELGDEVIWYVAGGSSSVGQGPDDPILGACGGDLFIGRYGHAIIEDMPDSSTIILDSSMMREPALVKNANLASATAVPGGNFCRISITRVPNFDTIDVQSGSTWNLLAGSYNHTTGYGGLIAIRTEMLIVDGTLNIGATGFTGAPSSQGSSPYGSGVANVTFSNSSGGGASMSFGGGGGGNGGTGGAAMASGGLGGQATDYCGGICNAFHDFKMFMGGAGGSGSSSGGMGGGIVLLFAREISGNGTLNIDASGSNGNGGSSGSGGGAGGTVGLYVQRLNVNTLMVQAKGGNGGTASTLGGGGGGGAIEMNFCQGSSDVYSSSSFSVVQGTGYSSGTPGLTTIVDKPFICGI